jgi:K(+)-stimulated pyrophosphate-energized sodium pump
VALNPVIKFTTLFGLLAVELAYELGKIQTGTDALGKAIFSFKANPTTIGLAAVFFVLSATFVYRSFYNMRIESVIKGDAEPAVKAAA